MIYIRNCVATDGISHEQCSQQQPDTKPERADFYRIAHLRSLFWCWGNQIKYNVHRTQFNTINDGTHKLNAIRFRGSLKDPKSRYNCTNSFSSMNCLERVFVHVFVCKVLKATCNECLLDMTLGATEKTNCCYKTQPDSFVMLRNKWNAIPMLDPPTRTHK